MRRRGDLDAAIPGSDSDRSRAQRCAFHALMGELLSKPGQLERAIVSFSLAAELGDRGSIAPRNWRAAHPDRRHGGGRAQLRSVLDLDRGCGCHVMLVHFLVRENRIDQALRTARQAWHLASAIRNS